MDLFPLSLVGGLIALDTTAALQGLISQPLISGIILGWLAGDIALGLHMGVLMQLLWLNQLPVGAAKIPEGNLASIIAVILTARLSIFYENSQNILILTVVLYALLFSWLGTALTTSIRSGNARLFDIISRTLDKECIYVLSAVHMAALLLQFIIQTAVIFFAVLIGQMLLQKILVVVPAEWNNIARYAELAIIGSGVGLTLSLYKEKKDVLFLLIGAILGVLFFLVM